MSTGGTPVPLEIKLNRIILHQGHVFEILRGLPAESVHCAVTSPPYWGIRDYGLEPQVWMLPDTDCPGHEWGEEKTANEIILETQPRNDQNGRFLTKSQPLIKTGRNDIACNTSTINTRTQDKEYSGPRHATQGSFCRLCGAWRGSYGLEPTLDCLGWATGQPCGQCYVCHTVQIFRGVRRVLRKDGTLWLNLGDSYYGGGGAHKDHHANPGLSKSSIRNGVPKCIGKAVTFNDGPNRQLRPGLKPKDLCGVPWRVALALQADGWWSRRDNIWFKPNPMPESCTDRPTTAHEYIFLLTKSAKYFYDAEAVREECQSGPSDIKKMEESKERIGGFYKENEDLLCKASKYTNIGRKRSVGSPNGRNLRSVWEIATHSFPGAHFATFPPALPERCIKAGTSEKGCCPKCGAPWKRVVEKNDPEGRLGKGYHDHQNDLARGQRGIFPAKGAPISTTTGWHPTCACNAMKPIPCTVLDPFAGAGTTGVVAAKLGRDAVLIELNPEYCRMAEARLKKDLGMLVEVEFAAN